MTLRIPRRTFLRGAGAAMALPLLDAMGPAGLRSAFAGAPARSVPKRLAFLYVPNGVVYPDWTPTAEGADFELPYILEPLKPIKDSLLVLSGPRARQGPAPRRRPRRPCARQRPPS